MEQDIIKMEEQGKIVQDTKINNSTVNNKQTKAKKYLGKATGSVANKIQDLTNINVENRKHVLTNNDIRHMLKQHGNQENEKLKGQIAITKQDIENISDIISNPNEIVLGTDNKKDKTIRYIKRYNNNFTYVVEVVPDKSKALIIKTMWKKPSTLTNSITTPSSTPKTQGSDISSTLIDNNITQSNGNVKSLSLNNIYQKININTINLKNLSFDLNKLIKITNFSTCFMILQEV